MRQIKLSLLVALPLAAFMLSATQVLADDEMAVDQADSLNFSEFHKDDANTANLFPGRQDKQNAVNFEAEAEAAAGVQSTRTTYMTRTRFTLTETSEKTPYSAVTVIVEQAKQMANTCPNGWLKVKEWVVPVEQDYYDQIEFACLD